MYSMQRVYQLNRTYTAITARSRQRSPEHDSTQEAKASYWKYRSFIGSIWALVCAEEWFLLLPWNVCTCEYRISRSYGSRRVSACIIWSVGTSGYRHSAEVETTIVSTQHTYISFYSNSWPKALYRFSWLFFVFTAKLLCRIPTLGLYSLRTLVSRPIVDGWSSMNLRLVARDGRLLLR